MRHGFAARALGFMALLVLSGLAAASTPRPASADFGACDDPNYMAGFDERFRTGPLGTDIPTYDCVERLRVPVSASSGVRHIRVLHDLNADWITDEALMAEIDRGVRSAVVQLGRMGTFDIRDVSVLVADDFPPSRDAESFREIAAWTYLDPTGTEPECQVTLFVIGPGGAAEHAAVAIAHEIFHCVQKASLSPEQTNSVTSVGGEARGGAWWLEASADWFASMAVEGPSYFQQRIDDFDAQSASTPLHHMSYQTLPFFWWLSTEDGEAAILPFLAGMATSSSDRAQTTAMREALPEDRWLAFAQAYLDGQIRRPRGAPVSFAPQEGETLRWEATRTVRRPLQPFVIDRAWIECDCGTWATDASPDEVHRVRPDSGPWGALPGRIDTEAGDDAWFRLAALNTGGAPRDLVFDFRHEVPCEGCGGGGLDTCAVGQWRLSAGGAVQWMRENLGPQVRIPVEERAGDVITLTRTGGYYSGEVRQHTVMTMDYADGRTRAVGDTRARGSGRWSAEGGTMTLCPAAERLDGQVTITRPDGSSGTMDLSPEGLAASAAAWRDHLDSLPPELLDDIPPHLRARLAEQRAYAAEAAANPMPPLGPQEMSYSCSGDTLRTSLPMPGRSPIISTYSRVG